ncbi:hypothetical protein E2C01_040509 [Portunus trituberculatus]|uniref:Uncharacterized protein n=1 Tax=Portunus trituberculatus TaxID=210409 RepID=A0A5B7FNZ0_PORTR|nr:hypothetical protein [Portunus trituberculatus]
MNSRRKHPTRYRLRGRVWSHMQTHSLDCQLRGRAWNRRSLPPIHSRSQTRERGHTETRSTTTSSHHQRA